MAKPRIGFTCSSLCNVELEIGEPSQPFLSKYVNGCWLSTCRLCKSLMFRNYFEINELEIGPTVSPRRRYLSRSLPCASTLPSSTFSYVIPAPSPLQFNPLRSLSSSLSEFFDYTAWSMVFCASSTANQQGDFSPFKIAIGIVKTNLAQPI